MNRSVPTTTPRRDVTELRVMAVAGPAARAGLDATCAWTEPAVDADMSGVDLLLVDSEGLAFLEPSVRAIAAAGLAQRAREHGVPSVYWASGAAEREQDASVLGALFDACAVADPALLHRPLPSGVRPVLVPWGSLVPVDLRRTLDRRDPLVAFVGGWSDTEPRGAAWREAVLTAAGPEHVEIVTLPTLEVQTTSSPVSEGFKERVTGSGWTDALALYARARVVVACDASRQSETFISPMLFQAIASGAIVISRPQAAVKSAFVRNATTFVKGRDPALAAMLEQWRTEPDGESQRQASVGPRMARRQHSFGHRLASLASLAGIRVLPPSPAALRTS
jgi:hypothetical protein